MGHIRNYSEEIASEIDGEVRSIISNAYNNTMGILNEHLDQLHTVANYLFENEKVDGETFTRLMTTGNADSTAIDTQVTI